MSGGSYGGDEVGALVLDVGSHTIKAGYAGEEMPKCVLPNCIGIVNEPDKKRRCLYDSTYLTVPRANLDITSPMKGGCIDNWDLFEEILGYTIKERLHSESEYHPILMSEPAWNGKEKREKLIELMFEKFNVPAFYLVKSPVLTAFANGRASGLIVDSGYTHTTAVPVYEGHILRRGMVTSPLGGHFVQQRMGDYLAHEKVEVHLHSEIREKMPLEKANEAPIFKLKENMPRVTQSWRGYQLQLMREDIIRNVCQLSDGPFREEEAALRPQEEYEFPTGFRKSFGVSRFRIPEPIFNPTLIDGKSSICGAAFLVSNSIHLCDADIRSQLMSNVILTGGNSLLTGFSERLVNELQARTPPALRFKLINLQSPQMTTERLFSPWIGGSILASLGTFHQMWISKREYEEKGKSIIETKCP